MLLQKIHVFPANKTGKLLKSYQNTAHEQSIVYELDENGSAAEILLETLNRVQG